MKAKGMLEMALAMAVLSEAGMHRQRGELREYTPNLKDYEPKPQKGQFHYWFRADGTFLSEKQGERMRKEECVFKCFAINDKNAIKKFKAFSDPSCQH